ncbi:MAG: hypothetical protein HY709_09450, partial [Candidatus Latescibacteria bacterium]|nr:hypothetical protein [Candidatus Latescibacterota bacterium]
MFIIVFSASDGWSATPLDTFRAFHDSSETIRHATDVYRDGINVKGAWGNGYADWPQEGCHHPLIRDAGRRILGYLAVYQATGDTAYQNRADDALHYLLREQVCDGDTCYFPWWVTSGDGA